MTCQRAHHIDLLNLRQDELVCHTILLVKGSVRQQHGDTPAEATEVELKLSSPTAERMMRQATPPSHRGEFKFLLDLTELPEAPAEAAEASAVPVQLSLSYCNAETTLRLRYAPQPVSAYRIQPLYIRCSDEATEDTDGPDGDAAACELIDLNVRLVQCVYAEKLREAGFERRTFALHGRCEVFRAQLTRQEAWQASEDTLWERCGRELLNAERWRGDAPRLKFVAFMACTRYDGAAVVRSGDLSYANIRKHLYGHAALGGGGLALFGSAYFYAWPRRFADVLPCFRSDVAVDLATQPDDSNYRRTVGGVYASTLGALAHEVGHTFDLAHTADGVMGRGFDLINRVFTVATATEHLPARVIHKGTLAAPTQQRPRFTQLRRGTANSFLDDYYEQRQSNDAFYFTRNCALILRHHRWLQHQSAIESCVPHATPTCITFDATDWLIAATGSPLRLVEVRACHNSLVTDFYELPAPPNNNNSSTGRGGAKATPPLDVFSFRLPASVRPQLQQGTHTLFALTADGQMARFSADERNGGNDGGGDGVGGESQTPARTQ